jgi:hypothetical protein
VCKEGTVGDERFFYVLHRGYWEKDIFSKAKKVPISAFD